MEADSTTIDHSSKTDINEISFPFPVSPGNFKLYEDLTVKEDERTLEIQIVKRLQAFGLLPKSIDCPTGGEDCNTICKAARVIDRIIWCCEGCGKRQPIRSGSFFLRLQCSLLQALQIILAWCEDADCEASALHFEVKPKVASLIYDRLDELAMKEQNKLKLGGRDNVVLAELYPDCLTRLSPDTTDQPHVHRILMLTDTNQVPTQYQFHVIKTELKKHGLSSIGNKTLKMEIEEVISDAILPESTVLTGSSLPALDIEGASPLQDMIQLYGDADMAHFLTSRIWRQALNLCTASRDLCHGTINPVCAGAVHRYLLASLYRLRFGDGFYEHILKSHQKE